ncbi:MAG: hypothetical protein DMG97_25595 [Acidobacteria bacterium]|nr:MAG: hypothetical protein DMG97_25595 [Acidobacteriota bacterium]PYV78796.1 MAG: hypothetical protein DMG96_06430 [Acidobacteriota bacterium]
MPIDEEQPEIAIEIADEAKRSIQGKLISSGIAGALSLVPGIGGAVTEMMTELAIQRTNTRIKDMFDYFVSRIRELGEQNVDREWFRSEDFQTLLFEALHQLHVTKDREKIEMLGVALGNSGSPAFEKEDRKDLFVRFVRDLAPEHIRMLTALCPRTSDQNWNPSLSEKTRWQLAWTRRLLLKPQGDDLLVLQMLHAYGLVEESLLSPVKNAPRVPSGYNKEAEIKGAFREFIKQLQKSPIREFRLSQLGWDFLEFTGLSRKKSEADARVAPAHRV